MKDGGRIYQGIMITRGRRGRKVLKRRRRGEERMREEEKEEAIVEVDR